MKASAVPLTSLDERYLTTSVVWDMSKLGIGFILSAPAERAGSAELDMTPLYETFESLTRTFPRLRQKIMRPLLGLHAPAWVVDETFDIRWHVRRYPRVVAADAIPPGLLAGLDNGVMEETKPPWDVMVAELDNGGLAISLRYHHVIGDGMFGRSMVMELTRPKDAARPDFPALPKAPRNKLSLMLASARAFRADVSSWREAWQEITRVPIHKRLRKVVARNTRPLREALGRRYGRIPVIAQRVPRRVALDFSSFRRYARSCGGGVGDLTAAVVAAALSRLEPDRERLQIMIPVSGRVRGGDPAGNQVKVMMVDLPAGDDLAQLTASVARQVAHALETDDFPLLQPGTWDAYATFLPGPPRPGPVAGYPMGSVVAWSAMGPREQYGIIASSCGPVLELGMMVGGGQDADEFLAAIEDVVAGTKAVSV